MPCRPSQRGLSLIEVSVAIGVIGAISAVAVPLVVSGRETSYEALCAVQQRGLHLAAAQWAASNSDRPPGVSTTGVKHMGSAENIRRMLGDQRPETPTSTYDWISPALGLEVGLSPNRAERTRQVFGRLGCPAAHEVNDALYDRDYASGDDADDFREIQEGERFAQVSYLSPAAFHLRGPAWPKTQYVTYRWSGPFVPPKRFIPRMTTVGAVSRKVFVADGTRYLTRGGVLDFDIAPSPKFFGSFTSSSPIYAGSVEYGRRVRPASGEFAGEVSRIVDDGNIELSYRHGGAIMAVFFDGSAGSISREESYADAIAWAPGGSVFTGKRATEEAKGRYREGEALP